MKKIDIRKPLLFVLLAVSSTVWAGEAGIGRDNDNPDVTPPETDAESCTFTTECTWQELLEIFTVESSDE